MISQGDVWWVDFPAPVGSSPGFKRPAVVVQSDAFNQSAIGTIVTVPLTSQLRHATYPGNVPLEGRATGLPQDSVAVVSGIIAADRSLFLERVGVVTPTALERILAGIDLVLGR